MCYELDRIHRGRILVLALVGLLVSTTSLQAEPVVHGSTQPANRLIDATQWLPSAQEVPPVAPDVQVKPASTKAAQPTQSLPPTDPRGRPASLTGLSEQSTSAATPQQTTRTAPPSPTAPKPVDDVLGQEIRDSVKDLVRPLYQDLATSGAAQALRGLQSELSQEKDQAFKSSEGGAKEQQDAGLPSEPTSWNEQTNGPPRTAAQVERDKILVSVMMDKLIADVTPWAIGLVALYVLGHLVKLAMAYGKHRSNRRRQRSLRRSRTRKTI